MNTAEARPAAMPEISDAPRSSSDAARLHLVRDSVASQGQCRNMGLVTGEVRRVYPPLYEVELDSRAYPAKRAAGCLVAPEQGDKVLLFRENDEYLYILSVLEKSAAASTLDFAGEVNVIAPAVHIRGDRQVQLHSADLNMHATQGTFSFLRLNVAARTVQTQIKTFHALMASVVQRVGRCLRIVEIDRVRAGRMQTQVQGRWKLHAKDVEAVAAKDVKMDGEQILLG